MDGDTKKTVWEEILFGTKYPSWILMLITIAYAFFFLIVLGIVP